MCMRPLQLGLAVAAGILFSALFSFAWTGPISSPPNGNVDAPINVGTTAQFKNGNIGLYGNILLAANGGSYLNFGSTSGSGGYGIRDNNGTLEFKSTGGTPSDGICARSIISRRATTMIRDWGSPGHE